MERHKRPGKKQTVSKSDSKDWEPLKVGITQSSSKEFNLDDVLDDEIDHDVIAKKLVDWTPSDVKRWMYNEGFSSFWPFIQQHNPTGIDLMMLNEYDWANLFLEAHLDNPVPSVIVTKRLIFRLNQVKLAQGLHKTAPKLSFCLTGNFSPQSDGERVPTIKHTFDLVDELDRDSLREAELHRRSPVFSSMTKVSNGNAKRDQSDSDLEEEEIENRQSQRECTHCHHQFIREKSEIPRERWKTLLAFGYSLVVSWVTAFVMVIVHDRVPDMQKYPPLPDILLDNIPHIPWAFEMCEMAGMILMTLWGIVLLFHKHRFVLMRRFFSISGTIFLLRCVTMLITSLSVPGRHLDCQPRPYGDLWNKLYNAYVIWTGAGMTIKGVRTCGDYMFSGHTVALTLLNFFITEYTSRKIYFLHTVTWVCNVFGVFFILAAHEHYSIDVFVAFYITSRLFMYYHTLANQPANINFQKKSTPTIGHFSYDSHRVWLWFPLFSFFESSIDGKIPNEFEWPITVKEVKTNFYNLTNDIHGILAKMLFLVKIDNHELLKNENKTHESKDTIKPKKRKQHFKRE